MKNNPNARQVLGLILGIVLTLLSAQSYAVERKVFYHNNLLGSPVAATDENGNLCWREDYRPYGEKLRNEDQGCGLDNNVTGFTGHVHDRDIGLTYMQARYYDPIVGRFMEIDPVGFSANKPGMFNRFAYGNNNPYKYIDPNGKAFALAFAPFAPEIGAGIAYLSGKIAALITIAIGAKVISEITGEQTPTAVHAEKADTPDIPDDYVGEKDDKWSEGKGRVKAGKLSPEHGGVGDPEKDFETLTGGNYGPADPELGYPPGTLVGENGISLRPGGKIDIPAKGKKKSETLHYSEVHQSADVQQGGGGEDHSSGISQESSHANEFF